GLIRCGYRQAVPTIVQKPGVDVESVPDTVQGGDLNGAFIDLDLQSDDFQIILGLEVERVLRPPDDLVAFHAELGYGRGFIVDDNMLVDGRDLAGEVRGRDLKDVLGLCFVQNDSLALQL